jgi:hypothetical protein
VELEHVIDILASCAIPIGVGLRSFGDDDLHPVTVASFSGVRSEPQLLDEWIRKCPQIARET